MKLELRSILICVLGFSLVGSAFGEQQLEPGLAGTTFDSTDFTRPIEDIDILDKCSNDWSGQRNDGSGQWEGFIQSPFSGEVTFTAMAVDGVRLLIDGKVVIDGLKDSSARSGKAVLEKGKMTPMTLEHITLDGKGQLHLFWQWQGKEPTIIPPSAIWHDRMKLDQEVLLRKKMITDTRSLRNKMLLDPYRPGYHFVIPEGLANPFDINGGIFWKGRYHLFYIFQQKGRGHSWGHISSIDMLHWRHHRVPLIGKEEGKPDRGMFSGCAFVNKEGVPTIVYHGVKAGTCIATSTDDNLDVWTKSEHNPVIKEVKKGDPNYRVYNVFDPVVWIHDGHYYAALGNAHILWKLKDELKPEEKRDRLFLFRSDDLINWQYLHPLYEPKPEWTGPFEDNACPEFFQLGDKWVLLFISHSRGCQYYIGRFENEHFYPETHGRMSWVDSGFFAPESLRDDKGREIMWSWIFDRRNGDTKAKSGWSGTFSLPRVLTIGEDNTLRINVPEELEALRYNEVTLKDVAIEAQFFSAFSETPLKQISGNSIELSLEMIGDEARQLGVKVCASPDGKEQTLVYYDAEHKMLKIDTTRSSLGEGQKTIEGGPFELKPGEPLMLRVFVDKSVVEVFANGRQTVMRRIYPTRKDSIGVSVFATGGDANVSVLKKWDMMPSNPY